MNEDKGHREERRSNTHVDTRDDDDVRVEPVVGERVALEEVAVCELSDRPVRLGNGRDGDAEAVSALLEPLRGVAV